MILNNHPKYHCNNCKFGKQNHEHANNLNIILLLRNKNKKKKRFDQKPQKSRILSCSAGWGNSENIGVEIKGRRLFHNRMFSYNNSFW
jgi:hypothetical protein